MNLGHYLLTFYRALTRHRLYAGLNVLGLAVGIAVFLTLWLDVRFETGFERWIPHAEQIYLVRTIWSGAFADIPSENESMGALLDELRQDDPRIAGTRLWERRATVRQGARPAYEDIGQVEPNFFELFDLPLVAGNRATAFRAPGDLVLTQSRARAYFGAADPIGRPLTLIFGGAVHSYRVAGVLKDPPPNTELPLGILVPLQPPDDSFWRDWGSSQVQTYLRFADPAQAAAFGAGLDRFVDRHASRTFPPSAHQTLRLKTQPLISLHLLDPRQAAIVAGLDVVGLLALVLAGVNYVNLATARAGLRAKEVAVRKTAGATETALAAQFMAEALATAALAAMLGVLLCAAVRPFVNAAWGLSLRLDYLGPYGVVWVALVLAVVLGLTAGAYPALVLSRFQPAAVLASAHAPGGGRLGRRLREALVAFQFAVATALIAGAGVVVAQTSYLRHADLGFRRDGLVVVRSMNDRALTPAQRIALIARWKALPGVIDATLAAAAPGEGDSRVTVEARTSRADAASSDLNYIEIDRDFLRTYDARLIAGRAPDPASPDDYRPFDPDMAAKAGVGVRPHSVLINLSAVKSLGYADASSAVGRLLYVERGRLPVHIIGVVDDIRFHSPRSPVPSTLYTPVRGDVQFPVAGVRYAGRDTRRVLDEMAGVWRQVAPALPFRARTAEDSLRDIYRPDDQHGRLFVMGAVAAVAIGCLGLYGLASFAAAQRMREVAIRKTLGASALDILRLLTGQLLRPVLAANLIAWPLAWVAMRNWLSGFDQRIALTPLYLLAATALTLAVALATVAGHALRMARARPAGALRYE